MTRVLPCAVIVAAAITLLIPASASADATLRSGDGSTHVKEAAFRTDVRVDGVVAAITTTHSFINTDTQPHMAIYTFQLPQPATITALSVTPPGGRRASSIAVDAHAAVTLAPRTPGATPDVALLRLLERETSTTGHDGDLRATYELRVYPIHKRRATTVQIQWAMSMRYEDGRLRLRVPARGPDGNLVGGAVSVTARPPQGSAGIGTLRGGGKQLTARHGSSSKKYSFRAPNTGDLFIEATPLFRSSAPIVSFAAVPMGPDFGAIAVSALAPRPIAKRSTAYERVLLVVDVSQSMSAPALAAAAEMTTAVLRAVPAGARVDAVLFDREAKRAIGELLPNLEDTRKIIARAITTTRQRNGSDLGAALDAVRDILARDRLPRIPPLGIVRGNGAHTLVAIISDGLTPLALTGKRAMDRIGDATIKHGEVLSITLVPDEAALPALDEGPLATLAQRTDGRSIAVRLGEVRARGATLSAELNGPTELASLALKAPPGTELRRLRLPKALTAGNGTTLVGWYHGLRPGRLTLTATRDRRPVSLKVHASTTGLRSSVGGLALSATGAIDALRVLAAGDDGANDDAARDRMLRAGARFHAVTPLQSLVVLGHDAFSRQRRSFAKRWGTRLHRRHAPPAEQESRAVFAAYAERATTAPTQAPIQGRTGSLDRRIVQRLVSTYVMPRVKACYEDALRRTPTMTGSLTVVLELARGEVQFAEMSKSTITDAPLLTCMTDAAYAMQVPRVALGATRDQVTLVRYPVRLSVAGTRAAVVPGKRRSPAPIELKGPLDGLPDR